MPTYRDIIIAFYPLRKKLLIDEKEALMSGKLREITFSFLTKYIRCNFKVDEDAENAAKVLFGNKLSSLPLPDHGSSAHLATSQHAEQLNDAKSNDGEEKRRSLAFTNYHSQAYRILVYLMPFDRDRKCADTRLFEVYSSLGKVQEQVLFLSKYWIGKNTEASFPTSTPSVFERIVYLMSFSYALKSQTGPVTARIVHEKRSNKKRKLIPFPSSKNLDRLGYGVQKVLGAWKYFAAHLLQESLEDMLLPYLSFDSAKCWFKVLSPGQISSQWTLNNESNVESLPEVAPIKDDAVHGVFRNISSRFLSDIVKYALQKRLYELRDGETWEAIEELKIEPEKGLPHCFNDFDANEMCRIALATSSGKCSRTGGSAKEEEDNSLLSQRSEDIEEESLPASDVGALCPREVSWESAEQVLERELCRYVRMHDCSFAELEGEDLCMYDPALSIPAATKTQLVLMEPPRIMRRIRDNEHTCNDTLTEEEMTDVVECVAGLLRAGGHAIVFCSHELFPIWQRIFEDYRTLQKSCIFDVAEAPLVMVSRVENVSRNVSSRDPHHTSVTEIPLHVCRKVIPGSQHEQHETRIDYKNYNHVPTTFPAWTNVVNNIPKGLAEEQAQCIGLDASKVGPDQQLQKSVHLLMELIERYTSPGDIVVDLFSRTFATAVACVSLPKHRVFVGCESNEASFEVGRKRVLEAFAESLARKTSGSDPEQSLENKIRDAAKIYNLHTARMKGVSSSGSDWNAPRGFPSFQRLPVHIVRVLATLWEAPQLCKGLLDMPPDYWPRHFQAMLHQVDVSYIRAFDASHYGLYIARTKIGYLRERRGLFAARSFSEEETIAPCFGVLVYRNLGAERSMSKVYGKGQMGCSVAQFKEHALPSMLAGRDARGCISISGKTYADVFVVPCNFSAAGAAVFSGRANDIVILKEQANAAIKYSRGWRRANSSTVLDPNAITIQALRDISPGEEIIVRCQ